MRIPCEGYGGVTTENPCHDNCRAGPPKRKGSGDHTFPPRRSAAARFRATLFASHAIRSLACCVALSSVSPLNRFLSTIPPMMYTSFSESFSSVVGESA